MSWAPNEWGLARGLDTLSLNIGRHPGGFLVVFLVTSYSSVSPSAPHSLHNSLPFNASYHILGMKSPHTRQGCNIGKILCQDVLPPVALFLRRALPVCPVTSVLRLWLPRVEKGVLKV